MRESCDHHLFFYIPPIINAAVACEKIHSVTTRLQTQLREEFIIISGDFNHFTLDSTLGLFHQAVDCPTRNNRTIDLLYASFRDAYRMTPLPLSGKSDQNLVHLHLLYTPLAQRQPATSHAICNGICPRRLLQLHGVGCAAGLTW